MQQKYGFIKILVTLVIILGIAGWLSYLFISGSKEPNVSVSASSFTVTGMYGGTYQFSDITAITLETNIPAIEKRTNGYSLKGVLKGNFELADYGACRLYLSNENGPYIVIKTKTNYIIMDFNNTDKTTTVYHELLNAWQSFNVS